MGICDNSCEGVKNCPEAGECCHSCIYYIEAKCVATGGNYYFPRHFKRLIVDV